jgi:hypothetical protein
MVIRDTYLCGIRRRQRIYSWARIQEQSSRLIEAKIETRDWRNMSKTDKSGFYEFMGRCWDDGEVMVGE